MQAFDHFFHLRNKTRTKIAYDCKAKRNRYVFEDGIPAASSYTVGKDKKIEIFVHPTGFRTFIEDIGEINRCTLMDTLLSHKTELIIQFIDLINSMA